MSEPEVPELVARLADEATAAIRALADSGEPAAFPALLRLSEETGVALGQAARALAESGSWSEVATHAGTSRQAAWSRWRA